MEPNSNMQAKNYVDSVQCEAKQKPVSTIETEDKECASCDYCKNDLLGDDPLEIAIKYYRNVCDTCKKLVDFKICIAMLIYEKDNKKINELTCKINSMFDDAEVYPLYMLQVSYDFVSEDGYVWNQNVSTLTLPLFRKFKNSDINRMTNQISYSEKLSKYYAIFQPTFRRDTVRITCSVGSAVVVKKKDMITLDD
jgi:hypothetical protein